MKNKRSGRRTIIAAVISAAMIIAMIPAASFAVTPEKTGALTVATAEQMYEALGGSSSIHEDPGNGNVVKLTEDVNLNNTTIKVTAGDITIDLNGYDIIFNETADNKNIRGFQLSGGNVTVTDTSASGSGKIRTDTARAKLFYVEKGTLKISAGNVAATGSRSYGIYIRNSKYAKVTLQGTEGQKTSIAGTSYAIKQNGRGKAKIGSAAKVTIKKTSYYYKTNLPSRKCTLITVTYITPQPAGVDLDKLSSTSAMLKWKRVSGADGYVIYKYSANRHKYVKGITVKSGYVHSCKCKNMAKNHKHYFKIKAYNTVNGKKIYSRYSKRVKISL